MALPFHIYGDDDDGNDSFIGHIYIEKNNYSFITNKRWQTSMCWTWNLPVLPDCTIQSSIEKAMNLFQLPSATQPEPIEPFS